jgi:hypothetical protein
MESNNSQKAAKTVYVTRTGLPLSFNFDWPFRHATSGADFEVLHAVITLENSSGLRALVAVNLSATLREVLPSLEPKDAEGPVINALRKEADNKQLEFVKSGKLVPLPFSSRHYSFKLKRWAFGSASDEEIEKMIERKVYWQNRVVGGAVSLSDPTEALYLDTSSEHIAEIAAGMAERGLFTITAGFASALPALIDRGEHFEAEMSRALHELEEKHAFERG